MSGVTAAEIIQERRDIAPLLVHRCQINRRTATGTDEQGTTIYGPYAPLVSNVPCLLYQETGPGETITPERASIVRGWFLMLAATQDITTDDTISNVVNVMGEVIAAGPVNITQVARGDDHTTVSLEGLS